jgi:hypothetical protein
MWNEEDDEAAAVWCSEDVGIVDTVKPLVVYVI